MQDTVYQMDSHSGRVVTGILLDLFGYLVETADLSWSGKDGSQNT